MKLINNKVYFAVQDYLMILLGTLLYGFGFNAFILSNEIITGGVSGICALIFLPVTRLFPFLYLTSLSTLFYYWLL